MGVSLFLYLKTFILPHTPIYQGDNSPVFLLGARRMLQGELIYRDFLELTPGGTELIYLVLFRLFGIQAWIPDAMLILTGLGLAWLSVVICKQLASGPSVFLPGLLYLTLAFGNALDATHHWFSILAVMAGLALVIDIRSVTRVSGAGALCGLAACFTPPRGITAVLGFAAFLLWQRRTEGQTGRWLVKREVGLFASFLATSAPLAAYFVWKVGLEPFLYNVAIFGMKYYPYFNRNNLGVYMVDVPDFAGWTQIPALAIWLFIHALVPLVYLVFLARYLREANDRSQEPWGRLMLVNLVGLSLFLSIAAAPNWFRVASASLPALILLVWFISSPSRLHKLSRRMLWFAGLSVALAGPTMVQVDGQGYLDTPVGRVACLEPERYEKFQWLLHRTQSREPFFEAGDTDAYFLLDLENPAPVTFLTPTEYTRPEQVQIVLEALEKHRVRFVLWPVWLDLPEEHHRTDDHLGPLRAYLHDNYRVVKTFGDGDQVWERRSDPGPETTR